MTITASIVGASGYGGGEVLRLLAAHPGVTVQQITSRQYAGKFVHAAHPNLRGVPGVADLKFTTPDALEPCDVLFLGLPHSKTAEQIEHYAGIGTKIIDLSADFRLRDRSEERRVGKECRSRWSPYH